MRVFSVFYAAVMGYNPPMYIDIVPNRNSRPAILLRESVREGTRIVKRTLANLSALSREQAEAIRAVLKGEPLAPVDSLFEIVRSRTHGAVQAIGVTMQRLHLGPLLDAKPSRERDLVLAMIAARVLDPQSKLATSRSWNHSTLGEWFGVGDADENELYAALDWLLKRQDAIERRLARRHLSEGGRVLYDLSSSYFEGSHCPLGQRGYSRDGKRASCRSITACSPMPGAVRCRSRCLPATRRIRRRCSNRWTPCKAALPWSR